ncbi:kinase-like domain-containing protein [Armillaria borealis]|uniref:Kinase-like domain-containing protein n=1 Tax=Armillaria borealis TaxID=47425 RepID=A0AA39JER9_9AGAR|nr:kinase-like domain-containing protein [Armillaria borealis]
MSVTVPHYFPRFLQNFWTLNANPHSCSSVPVHRYDVYANELSEVDLDDFKSDVSVFQDLIQEELYPGTQRALADAEVCFLKLQRWAEEILCEIIRSIHLPELEGGCSRRSIPLDPLKSCLLIKYFVFLRFRNSPQYSEIVHRISSDSGTRHGLDVAPYGYLFTQVRCRTFFKYIARFLVKMLSKTAVDMYCWDVAEVSEIFVGVTADENVEFLLPDACYGALDESFGLDAGEENVDLCDFFFPILPSVALYILGKSARSSHSRPTAIALDLRVRDRCSSSQCHDPLCRTTHEPVIVIAKAILFFPLLYRALDLLVRRISVQKFLQQTVTKMLVVKGDVAVTDLTDDVMMIGKDAVACGAFSDVWKGKWWDRVERKERAVAVKFLRRVMVQNVKEKLLKRLEAEVLTWHHLCHRNVSQLYGIVQSETSVGMVSAWCEHGTIRHYLKSVNPKADRMKLMSQVASGVAYLHAFKPPIVHGDLKGGNILIDRQGYAIITDFGTMRWMAPEMILALVEDESEPKVPRVTTASDVYAFGSVCLEIMTGALPYPCRKHDPGVMIDIMRGIKPSRGAPMPDSEAFSMLLDTCWRQEPALRPKMDEVLKCLNRLDAGTGS